jgi:outer membrane protein TolC
VRIRSSAILAIAGALFLHGSALAEEPPSRTAFEIDLDRQLGIPGGLTSELTARRAVTTSFDVGARQSELLAAAAEADRALLAYLPEVTVSAGYARLSDIGTQRLGILVAAPGEPEGPLPADAELFNAPITLVPLLNQYVLQANLSIPISDYFLRVAPASQAAESLQRAATANLATAQARVATDGRVAYYGWVRSRLAVGVAEQALRDAEAHLADARVAVGAGSANAADVLRVESQVARSEQYLVNTRSLAAVTEQQLRTALHDESSEPLAVGEDIRVDLPALSPAPETSSLWSEAAHHRPELQALDDNAAALEQKARAERAGYFPRFDLVAGATYANPNSRFLPPEEEFRGTWQVGARLSWSLTDIPAARDRALAASARGSAVAKDRAALLDRIRVEVVAALHALEDVEVALRTTRRSLASAEESYRVRRLLFQNARSTSVELLDAETELTRVRLESLNALVDTRIARVRLDYAVGHALPQQ